MTLSKALELTGIRENELSRISVSALDRVIKLTVEDAKTFDPYGHKAEQIEAYKFIREVIA